MGNPVIVSIGGGKGGVGKTILTTNLGAMLARKGLRVGFIDGDLRGANLHLCLGVQRPKVGLQDFLQHRVSSLDKVAHHTRIPNTWLVSGASDIVNLANPNFAQKRRLINNLRKMEADYVFVDLGAGADYHVCDFFAAYQHGIVVLDGLPTSVENAYGFLKNGIVRGFVRMFPGRKELHRRIRAMADPGSSSGVSTVAHMLRALAAEFPEESEHMKQWLHAKKTLLVLNMVRNKDDIVVGERFRELVKRYLETNLLYIGYVTYAPEIRDSVRAMQPAVVGDKDTTLTRCFEAVAANFLALTRG